MLTRARIEFEGIVQGVGFRPFLHQLADTMGLAGWVLNSSSGVLMELEGPRSDIDEYVRLVRDEGPALSYVLVARVRYIKPLGFMGFTIKPSRRDEGELTLLCPDVALCKDCARELNDPGDRRYRFPFINCTNCGPRYTIVKGLPYDRAATTMAEFALCNECLAEYTAIDNRRYHAQPIACSKCGPAVFFECNGLKAENDEAIAEAVAQLKRGAIIGIKGLGGFHLACLAGSDAAVLSLRKRKQRSFFKPLAIMVDSLDTARSICRANPAAEEWLTSTTSPVVLLDIEPKAIGNLVSRYVAPRLDRIGLMLPYTPLHMLLLEMVGAPLVMTSGNLSDEPIIHTNSKAKESLAGLADGLLMHNRPIQARCDDSVLAAGNNGGYTVFRHSRGLSPFPIALAEDGPEVLALGGDIKTTFAASRGHFAFLSPHLGDAEHPATYGFFRETWEHYRKLFNLNPQAIGCDLHPGYHTARWADELSSELGIPVVKVQHHHAHLVSLCTECGILDSQVAIVADGTGYGSNGQLWGGEILYGSASGCERLAHLRPILLPGGDAASLEPWRIAISLLHEAAPEHLDAYCNKLVHGEPFKFAGTETLTRVSEYENPAFSLPSTQEVKLVRELVRTRTAVAATSSLGRLLDGISALLGVTLMATYEGQAPMELEALARAAIPSRVQRMPGSGKGPEIDWRPLVSLLSAPATDLPLLAWVAHRWAAFALSKRAISAAIERKLPRILATGGCMQNSLLQEMLAMECAKNNLEITLHREVPANDGGLSLGILGATQAKIKYSN